MATPATAAAPSADAPPPMAMSEDVANGEAHEKELEEGGGEAEEESGEEDDGDDDEEEDEEEDAGNDPQALADIGRHSRMQRIQKVLYEQLVGNDERVSLELRDKDEELKRIKQAREDVGVALYGVQQQLAQLQMALEASHRKLTGLHDDRFRAEDQLSEWKETLGGRQVQAERNRAQVYKTQAELDALNATLRQVEKYNQEMKDEIARTQRAAHKAEETMTTMEKGKVQQDLYIDSLNEQVKALQDKSATHVAQLKAQQMETRAAEETLREASAQMEAVSFEKKQLMQQWKSSLIGLQQRDTALQATQSAISQVAEQELSLAAEVRGFKQSVAQAQTQHETLTATLERFQVEIRYVEEQTQALRGEHERLAERYELLTKSLAQTEAQAAKVTTEAKRVELDTSQVQQHLETTQRERHALEDRMATHKNTQTTMHKAANNLTKEAQRVQHVIHAQELALANLRNEMARVDVDILNVEAHASQLEASHDKLVAELKADDLAVEKMELEMRQRNDEIEKKMLRLDRLNKKYDALVAQLEDANTGPLEATIKHVARETAEVRQRNLAQQQAWLAMQTALVQASTEAQELSERNHEKKATASVLEQKQLRLRHDLACRLKDLRELRQGLTVLHGDTAKLNDLIARHTSRQDELLQQNHGLERECKRELQELEAESMAMERQALALASDKRELLARVVEAERQVMLWEKKIQLERETQAALDPEVGQAEARAMEKEIHRMRLRLEALQRSQEQLLLDMEQAIRKRDVLALRGRSKKDGDQTYAALTSKVSTLQNAVRKAEKDMASLDKQIRTRALHCEDVGFQLEKARAELRVDEERGVALQKAINDALYDKQRLLDAEARKRRLAKRLDTLLARLDAQQQSQSPQQNQSHAAEEPAKAVADHERALGAVAAVRALLEQLQQQHPHLADVLARVALLADDPAL